MQAANAAPNGIPALPAAWTLYFPAREFRPDDRRALLIADLARYFASSPGWRQLSETLANPYEDRFHCQLDYESLLDGSRCEVVAEALSQLPEDALACVAAAAYEAAFGPPRLAAADGLLRAGQNPGRIAIRLVNHSPSVMAARQLKSASIGKLATITGTVVRCSHVKPLVVEMDFACGK